MEGTITYKAEFEIKCWHEFCGPCDWREKKKCLLLDQTLREVNLNAYDEGPTILRCKTCVALCSNLPYADLEG